ncbi:MAG: transposase [Gemmatimonadota bacterium]
MIYTNLGEREPIDTLLRDAGRADLIHPERILELYHGRGRDELVHRALKEFRREQLPFRRFQSNAAFFYTTLLAFFLFETFKRDVTAEVVPVVAQPTRLRREAIDFAAKLVRHGGQTVLKVTGAVWRRLHISDLWERAAQPPPFAWA